MRDVSVFSHFADHPLTPRERSRGRALRVVCCVRSDEGRFEDGPVSQLWAVLSCVREEGAGKVEKGENSATERPAAESSGDAHDATPEPQTPPRPRCVTLSRASGPGIVRSPSTELLARRRLTLDGEAWLADEYAARIPVGRAPVLFLAEGCCALVGVRGRRDQLRAYDERIANASVDPGYPEWLERRRVELLARPVPEAGPLMSIVTPVFRTPPELLREMLASVLAQTYTAWELVLVNASPEDEGVRAVLGELRDPRVRVVDVPENLGIVGNTNLGIAHATGDYVSFLDHDDTVEPQALAELVRAIGESGGRTGLLWCDEDNIDEQGRPSLPLLKPGANEDFLLSNNYVIHWLTIRRDLLARMGPSGPEVEGAQDYDLTLKALELGEPVLRVPEVLYHWRICEGSSAADPASKAYAQDAGTRAIEAHLARTGAPGAVERGRAYFTYRTTFPVPDPAPSIRVVCAGETCGEAADALEAYARRRGARLSFAAAGAAGAGGPQPDLAALASYEEDLLLAITPDHALDLESLELLVGQACQPGVFSAAPRVLRADGLLDYAGMTVRPDGSLGRLLRYLPQDDGGYVGRAQRPYDALVVNPECCLLDARALAGLSLEGGFETAGFSLAEAFVRAYGRGLRNVYLPYATATLTSPRSLLGDDPAPGQERDAARLLGLFPELAEGDPSHSPNFDPWNGYYRLSWS